MKPRIGSVLSAAFRLIVFITSLALLSSPPPARAADVELIDRITSAPAFLQRILWVGTQAPPVTESDALWSALEQMRDNGPQSGFAALEAFVARHPKSAWTPSVRANLAYMYREHGRYTPALEHWEQAWAATRHDKTGDGKAVADYVLAHWTRLLASLGRLETLEELMEETRDRLLDGGPLQQMFNATKEGVHTMKFQPDIAYRCGTFALASVARALELPSTNWVGILEIPSPETGFSIEDLRRYSGDFELGLRAVRRPEGATELAIPSVVHWRQNHYAALVAEEGDYIEVADPTFGRKRWLHRDVVNSEASGHFLVAATGTPGNWRELQEAEAGAVYGRGYSTNFEDGDDEDCPKDEDPDSESQDAEAPITQHDPNAQDECEECPPGSGGNGEPCEDNPEGCSPCETGQGMAVWRVSQPWTSLTLIDTPLYYTTSSGKRFAATMTYKQRNTADHSYFFGFGPYWECNLLSYLKVDVSVPNQAIFYAPQGGRRYYVPNGASHFRNYSRVSVNGSDYTISYSKGGNVVYNQPVSLWSGITMYFPTQRIDRRGRITHYGYQLWSGSLRLSYMYDQDLRTVNFYYNNPTYPTRVTEIRDYMNRSAKFTYNAGGRLTNIEDAHGISTSFVYDAQGFITSMTTPYGPTLFHKGPDAQLGTNNVINRWLRVTEPNGAKQLFIYRNMSQYLSQQNPQPLIPDQYPDQIPDTGLVVNSIRTDGLFWENSFHWGRQQYAALSSSFQATGNPNDLTVADYDLAHMKNWLRHADLIKRVGRVPNMERLPSPDGQTVGQITWYDYAPKPSIHYEGEHAAPSMVATVLPNGQTRFTDYFRNGLGKPISVYSTYDNGGTIDYRETVYDYDIDGISLKKITHLRSSGPETVVEYGYHPTLPRTITSITRHADTTTTYTTTYGYNPQGRLTSRQSSTGLNTTYSYDANGFLSQVTDSPVSRTELYTYLGGNVRTHTDWRGYMRTFTHDNLQRLTRIDYPGGSYEEFRYTSNGLTTGPKWLDLTYHRDRMGYVTKHTYNALRQRTSTTNPRNFTTTFAYCPCGTLESIDDPAPEGGLTEFFYDFNGRRTTVIFPDNTFINYNYNRAGQLIEAEDVLGLWTLDYNIQGLLTNVVSPAIPVGLVLGVEYDIDDHPVAVTDANDVTRVQTFDRLGRLLTRSWPDTGVETLVWSARGLTGYTDQEGKAASYAYDQASRRTSHTTPNTETLAYTYNAAGDLLTLTDGRGKITTWTYDNQGRNTAKKYHGQTFNQLTYGYNNNGWLTWRRQWTTGSTYQHTGYSYDPNGNLTFINYPTGTTDVSLAYDAMDRVTQMIDAAGTTAYTYHLNRRLQTENGPWANDTVTYGYHAQSPFLRTSLTLQQPAGSWTQSYAYDAARRLDTLTSPAGQFAYGYHLAGRKVENLFLPTGGRIANDYTTDPLARLTGTWLLNSSQQTLNYHGYEHNLRNDITRHTRTDASFVDYDYDNLGQLTDAVGSGGQSVELLAYGYDTGWNMTGDGTTGYFVNDRNQVTGMTDGTNLGYDAHGNLLGQDNWNQQYGLIYTYDAENRLTRVEEDTYYIPQNALRTDFVYDGLSRLRIRREYLYTSGWALTGETRYIYDGRRVIQERSSANTPTVTYTRGSDLSGSLEGAGGIGGMLARSHGYSGSTGAWSTHNYYHADAGGNITCLINSGQSITASYRYDPFGRTLFQTGTMANANVYRFSSKEVHGFTGMYYYGFRFYDPGLQRWINRDPIEEFGGLNLYGFVSNNPISHYDALGLAEVYCKRKDGKEERLHNASVDDLIKKLEEAAKENNPIDDLRIKDHASKELMQMSNESFLTTSGGKILDDKGRDLTDKFKKGLTPNAMICLNGCATGRGKNNIAKDMSQILPGTIVAGGRGMFQMNVPFTSSAIGKKNYYYKGEVCNSEW